jgi:hypothetical protein
MSQTRILATMFASGLALMQAARARAAEDAADLARQATDPTASLMSLGIIADYTGGFHEPGSGDDDAFGLTFRAAIPFKAFGKSHILRMTLPYQVSGRGEEGLGDVTIFDIVVNEASWGRWAVGAVATLATRDTAVDNIAIGPAIGAVRPISKKLNIGVFNQNVFAGDTAVSSLQPVVAYQLGEGWSLSAGELQFVYDWKNSRWLSIPIGFQVGKVARLGGQPIRLAVNPQYNLADDPGFKRWSVSFTFNLIVPGT